LSAQPIHRLGRATFALLTLCSTLALFERSARAQPIPKENFTDPTYDLQLFRPAIDSRGYVTLNSARTMGHLDFAIGLYGTWAFQPLSMQLDSGQAYPVPPGMPGMGNVNSGRTFSVDHLVTPQLMFALGLFKHFEIALGLPVGIMIGKRQLCDGASDECHGYAPMTGGSLNPSASDSLRFSRVYIGDLPIHLKGRIIDPLASWSKRWGLGAVLSMYLPIANWANNDARNAFLGEANFTLRPQIILERDFDEARRFRMVLNVGALVRFSQATFTDYGARVDVQMSNSFQAFCYPNDTTINPATPCGTGMSRTVGTQLTYGLGFAAGVVKDRLDLLGEVYGYADVTGAEKAYPLEVLGALKVYLAQNSFLVFGAGAGVVGNGGDMTGSPRVRAFLGIVYEPRIGDRDGDGIRDNIDQCPDQPEDLDGFQDEDGCPELDNDGDGIPDSKDKCPTVKGTWERQGCPEEGDRDGDGIVDSLDKCPDDPEDVDGFDDEDGCPELDNDQDGIPDNLDKCPNEAEDKDGFEDSDGCPDPDNDKDNILDKQDKCPDKPETYNGVEDEDGCPDAEKGRVMRTKGKIEILDKVYFDTGKTTIKPVSFAILDAVFVLLKNSPDIELIEIQGHADERGNDNANMKLTQGRVQSVKEYLVKKGIDDNRLVAQGYGETRPLCQERKEECWEKNRRVEFVILKPAGDASGVQSAPPPPPPPAVEEKSEPKKKKKK
jgi:OOP family OmpA-OmpF porin